MSHVALVYQLGMRVLRHGPFFELFLEIQGREARGTTRDCNYYVCHDSSGPMYITHKNQILSTVSCVSTRWKYT